LYIKQNEAGEFVIYLGALKSKEQRYIDSLDESERVKTMVSSVQSSFESVVSTDKDVREFYEMLENAGDDSSEE
jgi:hypothetical protein